MEHHCPIHTHFLKGPFYGEEFLAWEVTLTGGIPSALPTRSLLSSLFSPSPPTNGIPKAPEPTLTLESLLPEAPAKAEGGMSARGAQPPASSPTVTRSLPLPSKPARCNLPATGGCPRVFRLGEVGVGGNSAVTPTFRHPSKTEGTATTRWQDGGVDGGR